MARFGLFAKQLDCYRVSIQSHDDKKILISQPYPTSEKSPYFDIEKKYGVEIIFHPFIKVEGLSAKEFRQQKVQILDHTAIVFTSRHAIDHFFTLCKELRVNIPEDMKYFGLSETIALYIQKYVQYRKRKVFFSQTGKWPDLVQVMAKHKTEKYLIPQSSVHTNEVEEALNAKKLNHTECVMYRTVSNDLPKAIEDYDLVIPFTPSGFEILCENYPDFRQRASSSDALAAPRSKRLPTAAMSPPSLRLRRKHPQCPLA